MQTVGSRRLETIERARAAYREERARMPAFNIATPRYQIGSPQWSAPNAETFGTAFRSQAAVYACILKRANGVSQAPLRIYKESDGDPDEQPEHGLRALLANPNPTMSEAEFHVYTITHMDAVGFAALEIVRAQAGNPLQLWHLRPDWLRFIPQNQAPPTWEYRVPGNIPRTLKADEIVIIPSGPNTDLSPVGMSPIEVALREIGINDSATDYLKLFLDTGGMPRVALISEKPINDQAKADAIREKWSQVYGGYRNWTQIALLHGGWKVEQIGASMDELAYPELRALLETHICSVFGVPPILIGIQAGLDASTYSNYAQARKAFFEDTISALWSRIAGAIGRALLPEFGDATGVYGEFDTSRVVALQEDATTKATRARDALVAGGITLNQFQAALGLPGFGTNGDVLFLPMSVSPTKPKDLLSLADEAAKPPEPMPTALDPNADATTGNDAKKIGDGKTAPPVAGDGKAKPGAAGGDDTKRDEWEFVDVVMADAKEVRTIPLEMRQRIVSGNRRQVTRLASRYYPQIRALFAAHGARVASAYGNRDARPLLEERDYVVLPSREMAEKYAQRDLGDLESLFGELDDEMTELLTGLYRQAGQVSHKQASRVVGVDIDFTLSNPLVRGTMKDLAKRIVGINETTRDDVRRVIADGIEAGRNHAQLAEDVRGLYEETYKGRSLTIARTESQIAYNLGTADAYKASGRVLAMILHDNPEHTDDYGASDGLTCAERDGVITDVDSVDQHIYAEHPNGQLAASPLLVRPLGEDE